MSGSPLPQVECVMNVSEGRNPATVAALGDAIESVPGAYLLDTDSDPDHHRTVLSFLGDLESCPLAAFQVIGRAIERIDLRRHRGVHPRVGAVDVVPFVPIKNVSTEACVAAARDLAAKVGREYSLPVYLYESAALRSERANLAVIRKGGLEALGKRLASDPAWLPDFGPAQLHPSAGACVIGVRQALIAFNIFLESKDVALARRIASRIRERDGGLKAVKALGLYLEHREQVQVSMNLTDFRTTPLQEVFQRVGEEARVEGTTVSGSELIGMVPRDAIPPGLERVLMLEDFSADRILENRIEKVLKSQDSPWAKGN